MSTPSAPKVKPRERIITAGSRLFLEEGIHAVGVDRLSEEAAVSKRSLYQHFEGKYDVLQAVMEQVGPRILSLYLPAAEDADAPLDEMLGVFDAIQRLSTSDRFVGCPFVNVATELRDPDHPSARQARAFKQQLTAFFGRQASRMGILEPEVLATQLTMLFDGACAHAVVQRAAIPPTTRDAAAALIRAAAVDPSADPRVAEAAAPRR